MPFEFKHHQDHPIRLSDWVKDLLKKALWEGELKPGDRLPSEEEISRELKVSKVTVREALREMESDIRMPEKAFEPPRPEALWKTTCIRYRQECRRSHPV